MTTVILDDRDPSVVYTGYWGGGGTKGVEYDGTITYANSIGGTHFATVTFTGSRISVFGTIRTQDQPSSSYTVDTLEGNKTTTFKLPDSDVSTVDLHNYTFFQSDALSPTGQHSLVITPIEGTLYLDSFAIVKGTLSSSLTSSSSSSLPSTTQRSSSSGSTLGASASAVTGGQGKSRVPINSIIGGALGALALILIFVLALFWIRRRRREDHFSENKDAPPPPGLNTQVQPLIQPFDISRPPQLDRKGQPFVSTGTGPAVIETTTSSLITTPMQPSSESQQVPAVATAPSSSSGTTNSGNPVPSGALGSLPSVSGGLMSDPPPVYHG